MEISFSAIARFFKERAADLRRIARRTEGEIEVSEVESEAWLAAEEISKKRGYPFDFDDRVDQETLLGRLYNRLVKFADKHIRYAVALDSDSEDETPSFGAVLARILTAPATSDPSVLLQQEEDADAVGVAVQRSYSEAAAYMLLLMRFEWQALQLALHLRIALTTLRLRLRRAGARVKMEPSLFDDIEKIPEDFRATIGRPRVEDQRVHLSGKQWEWSGALPSSMPPSPPPADPDRPFG